MATRIYRIGYAFSVFTVRISNNVPSAFTVPSVNLYCAHSPHVAAIPPSDNTRLAKLLFLNCISTNYLIDYDWVRDLYGPDAPRL
jgi:hypothetical protein